jgi:hypothetical protein
MSGMVLRTPAIVTLDPALGVQHSKAVPTENAPEAQAKNHASPLASDRNLRSTAELAFSFIASRYVRCGQCVRKLSTSWRQEKMD